jgi:hypothetical protein
MSLHAQARFIPSAFSRRTIHISAQLAWPRLATVRGPSEGRLVAASSKRVEFRIRLEPIRTTIENVHTFSPKSTKAYERGVQFLADEEREITCTKNRGQGHF